MSPKENAITKALFAMQDLKYRDFHKKLIPTVSEDLIIGVRMPDLRKFAKELYRQDRDASLAFLEELPHKYFDENNLHGFIIENIKEFESAIELTEKFLPYIDNWATCDIFSPKVFKKYPAQTYAKIKKWLKSDHTYTARYGAGLLLSNFLDEEFEQEMPALVAALKSEEYYVRMMVAWYFATALAKQHDAVIAYITERRLPKWTHNKTIQKAIESRRISEETKEYLRSLKF